MLKLSLVAENWATLQLWCVSVSLWWFSLLWSTGSRLEGFNSHGSWAPEHKLSSCGTWSCSTACGIYPNLGSNLCLLHWHVDSLPRNHQKSPIFHVFISQKPGCTLHLMPGENTASVYIAVCLEKTRAPLTNDDILNLWNTIIKKACVYYVTWIISFSHHNPSRVEILLPLPCRRGNWSERWKRVTQSCPTLCDPHGLHSPWNSPGQKTGMGSLSLPNPGVELGSPALQADSLPTDLSRKPWSQEVLIRAVEQLDHVPTPNK